MGDLEALYRQHALAVFRFALGLCRNRSEAEDIVAETFARVLTRVSTIEGATARAHLLTVARNIFLDAQRRSARDARLLQEMEHEQPETGERLDHRARLARALKALGALPEGERAARRGDNRAGAIELAAFAVAITVAIAIAVSTALAAAGAAANPYIVPMSLLCQRRDCACCAG